jgi:hypothetical protein
MSYQYSPLVGPNSQWILQKISIENLVQPVKLESSSKTFPNNILMKSNSKFQQSNHNLSQNRSLHSANKNGSSNQFTARTNLLRLISNHIEH